MFYRLRSKIERYRLNFAIRDILRTRSIKYEEGNHTILSMISHQDLSLYLLAVKSFYSKLGSGKILIINDGTLTEEDESILRHHLVSPKIIHRKTIFVGRFLQHIMWERLAYAIDLSEQEYVIQLDTDTVTIGSVNDVRACIAANRAFTLGTWNGREVVSARQASAFAQTLKSDHIQIEVERVLERLPSGESLRYVRGSAGLAGLARGGFGRRAAEEFCVNMTKIFGNSFSKWGTDQIAFNFIVANSPDPYILPYPTYACFGPELKVEEAAFLHFIGTYRFKGGIYARMGRRFIVTCDFARAEHER